MNDAFVAIFGTILIVAIATLKKPLKEDFFGLLPAQTYRRDVEYQEPKYGAQMYSVPPSYQAALSPRFSNVGYGAYIRYNVPPKQDLAVPDYPLTYGSDISVESFQKPGPMNAQKAAALNTFVADTQKGIFQTPTCNAPSDVNMMNAGSEGAPQPIVYDRLVFANKRSRLYGRGDPIRGDLPIAPIQSDWFRPSVYPNIDLREGAMNVIAGHDNSTANELRALQSEYSGRTALAQKGMSLAGPQSDIIVTAFP